MGKVGTNELVLAELIRQQRQIEGESRALTKAERRSRERNSSMKLRRQCSALASMGTQELPCFVRLKKSPVFLQQLTGLYCETGKDSNELAPECHN